MAPTPKRVRRRCSAENLAAKHDALSDGWDRFPRWLRRSREITPLAKILYAYLLQCVRIQGAGMCFPSVAQIAIECGVDERTVQRRLPELRGCGLIEYDPKSGRKSNEYTILKPRQSATVQPTIQPRQSATPTPAICRTNPGKLSANPGNLPPEVDVVSRERKEKKEVDGVSTPTPAVAASALKAPAPAWVPRNGTGRHVETRDQMLARFNQYRRERGI